MNSIKATYKGFVNLNFQFNLVKFQITIIDIDIDIGVGMDNYKIIDIKKF